MTGDELKAILDAAGLSQADFARLLGVTSRAVNLWMVGDRAIPGPAEAYLRLLGALPPNLRQAELARLRERKPPMREGMYGIEFQSGSGAGIGVLVLENGRAYGVDAGGVKYDGGYVYDDKTGFAELSLKLTFAPNTPAVFGIRHPYEWAIDVSTRLDPRQERGRLRLATPIGPTVDVQYRYLRSLPDA
ncbi:helix-turn-helix domain-containing protein [Labrys wisconsinensis]|uniref:HTH cro/C1-type domain-containing protein n=1 Tax=Labrys wisconsinensis TaxID=425677 RepID=A0ABU0JJJ0_9HYPH|nr:helix-turn-helix domain-containing protein [Labrys wisconsinensis]MDQ0473775.1 hypothetical protein [Labrys wisconsinensis]